MKMEKEKTSFQQLEEVMEIAPAPVLKVVEAVNHAVVEAKEERQNRPEALADEAREVYRRALEKVEDLADEMTMVAKGSERARDYEVANGLLRTMVDIAEKIKNSNFQNDPNVSQGNTQNTQNNLYIGSSEELMKLIRTNSKS